MKFPSIAVAVLASVFALATFNAGAAEPKVQTIAALHQNKAALAGKTISAKGKVVKVNNSIMGRNFLHIQDGTGDSKSNDLAITSKQTAKIGDQITISGVVVLNKDFGSGYTYPLLIEEATIAAK